MTEMTAFERRVADGMLHRAGPIRPVDDLAVYESIIAANRQKGWGFSMFSALKFVAAAVIVALFGGFLLAGALTTQQADEMAPAAVTESSSPMTTEELLAGMVTAEVEPGVLRVLDDGAGHAPLEMQADHVSLRGLEALHIEPDGSVWVVTSVSGGDWGRDVDKSVIWQVGAEGRFGQRDGFPGHEYPNRMPSDLTFANAPDGTLWAAGGLGLGSFDGDAWAPHGEDIWANTVEVLPDGSIWAAWPDRVGRLGPDGWEWFHTNDGVPREVYQFASSPDGRVFATGSGRLVGFDGVAWHDVQPFGTDSDKKVIGLRAGKDGTLWAHLSDVTWSTDLTPPWLVKGYATDRASSQQHYLAHFDGDAWVVYSPTDGVPRLTDWEVHSDGSVWVLADLVEVDGDDAVGTLSSFDGEVWTERSEAVEWFTIGPDGSVWAVAPDGVASFDGEVWTHYDDILTGWNQYEGYKHSILDVAPDGRVWALGDEHSLYVITPEAVAAGE